jgi:hypothetical protein
VWLPLACWSGERTRPQVAPTRAEDQRKQGCKHSPDRYASRRGNSFPSPYRRGRKDCKEDQPGELEDPHVLPPVRPAQGNHGRQGDRMAAAVCWVPQADPLTPMVCKAQVGRERGHGSRALPCEHARNLIRCPGQERTSPASPCWATNLMNNLRPAHPTGTHLLRHRAVRKPRPSIAVGPASPCEQPRRAANLSVSPTGSEPIRGRHQALGRSRA